MAHLIILVHLLFSLANVCISIDTASFYGASYIAVPLQDAKSTTDIHLRFRTRRPDALLLLAAGRTDYCLVRLESGRLKVHINVGAGETEVTSPKGLRLDDLGWHDVVIARREAAFTLRVDTIHVVKEKLPGRFFELNIHYGLFLGGQGDFSELFLGHLETLRGCLSEVTYNGVNVLGKARDRQGQVDVHGITWNCALEFDAGSDKDLSFVEDGAFVALPKAVSRTGARWQFEMKTFALQAVLLYNTGLASRSDFVGVELSAGHLRLLLNKGNGAVELRSDRSVADGKWHTVTIQFNPTFMEINVDGGVASLRLPAGGNRYLDLSEMAYVGGIELNKRARALGQGIQAAETSFKGCLKNMAVEGKRLGIPDARITQGILPDCVWEYPCADDPCIKDGQCLQQGISSFRCECEQALCVRPDYTAAHTVFSRELEIIELAPLQLAEGDNAIVTTRHIDVVLDYAKFGVRDSGVLIYVVDAPRHGKMAVEVWDRAAATVANPVFTLLDLAKDKVRYVHDGSESHQDSVVFELELAAGPGFILPGYLQGRHRFVLPVNVTPVNDPPSLVLPPEKVLRLAQGTRKVLSSDLLHASDPDSPSEDLVYSVLSGEDNGHVERVSAPGVAVDVFTQLDVDQGAIVYVHHGEANDNRLALQVSDGIETGAAAFLRVSAFPLQSRLVNNTGLVLTHTASAPITAYNLTFLSNAEDTTLDVRYDVVKAPQYGSVQRLRGDTQWQVTDHFTSHQIARGQVRYVHNAGEPTHDDFKFKVSVLEVRSPTVYDFRITFAKLRLLTIHNVELQMNGTREATLTDSHLQYATEPLTVDNANIVFWVQRLPRYGVLHLKHHRVKVGDSFTQQDLTTGHLRYRLHRKSYSHVRDEFGFRVTALEAEPKLGSLALVHMPSGETRQEVTATVERLQVSEGGKQALLPTQLHLSTAGITELTYNVTRGPHHGRLDVSDQRRATTYFTSRELLAEKVFYVHDDSETRRDSFHFVALSSEAEDFQYVGVFHVDVLLKNDNTPLRAVDRVFRVVTAGERLLTGRDLRYTDADVDTRPADIVYTRRGIPNGGIYRATDPSTPLFEFSQEDLDKQLVLFRHEGDEYGKVGLWITDGQYYANGILEVRASAPFTQVVNNTGLVVRHSGHAALTMTNLSSETNLNLRSESIEYELLEGPSHGQLQLEQRLTGPAVHFTQADLDKGIVVYYHDGSSSVSDHFRFRVGAGTTSAEGKFPIRIFPISYWEPLVVTKNRTLHVEESTSVVISDLYLKVMHPQIPATDITYMVVEPPEFGYLEIETETGEVEEAKPGGVTLFDQALLDEGRLHYIQATANHTRDEIIFDVTNGISWLRGLVFNFLVVPDSLYIGAADVKVVEGETVTFPPGFITVMTEYYRELVTEYRIIDQPRFGIIQLSKKPSVKIDKFLASEMKAGLVQYKHDGSETLSDQFSFVGIAGGKSSAPNVVKISVVPVNDQPPHIARNAGITFFEGAGGIITSNHLAAVDEDTPAQNLTFTISNLDKGSVALISALTRPIEQFTQQQIDQNQVVFVHKGGQGGGFDMTVSDGVKTSGLLSFRVTVKRVFLKAVFKTPLHVFPLRRQCLTLAQLLYETSDKRPITFHVKRPTTLGRLVLDSDPPGNTVPASNFTQRDVNNSRVCYEHTHPFFGLTTNDSFTFDVRADFAKPIQDQEISIDISVSSGGLDQFLQLAPLTVEEGGATPVRINITEVIKFLEAHADLELPLLLIQLSVWPKHGEVSIAGSTNITSFTPEQLIAGSVIYQHDHSDTLSDQLQLSIFLEPGEVLLCNVTVHIIVTPINDQPFSLLTPAPHISVVQGQAQLITRADLMTEDADSRPTELVYDVISGPSQGRLVMLGNNSGPLVKFTQDDINAERIVYDHTGPLQPAKFYFRVGDGHFNPVYTVFNIHVLPLLLNVTTGSRVLLQQGSSVVLITDDHLVFNTNALRADVLFNVTRPPRHGTVYVHDAAALYFTSADLAAKRVMYMQTDMTTPSDSLSLVAWLPNGPVVELELNVTVEPLLRVGNFTPTAGARNRMTLKVLDATPLAKLTNSNPVFQVLKRPRLGRIKKVIRSSGENRNVREREVNRFSHDELASGVIYYVAKRLPELDGDGAFDGFPFRLAASIFQPALGELSFLVLPEYDNASTTPPILTGPQDPVGREGGLAVASPNISSDYILIVSTVTGVVLLAIIVITVVKCRSVYSESRTCKTTPPLALPRPPDDLPPSSPLPKRFTSNGSSPIPLGTPIPPAVAMLQCKVIPLEPMDSVASSDIDLNARYPYGVADEQTEDWSSYDTSELAYPPRTANPMLRRNQYWV